MLSTERKKVICAEDGCRSSALPQETPSGLFARWDRHLTHFNVVDLAQLKTRSAERIEKSFPAVTALRYSLRPVDQSESSVTQLKEMLRCNPPPGNVVNADATLLVWGSESVEKNDGRSTLTYITVNRRGATAGRSHQYSGDLLLLEELELPLLASAVAARIADDDKVIYLVCRGFHAAGNGREERIIDIEYDKADRWASCSTHLPCSRVANEAKILNCGLDAAQGLLGDKMWAVQGVRHRADGYAGSLSHLSDRQVAHGPPFEKVLRTC